MQELGREIAAEVEPTLVSIRITLATYKRVVGRCHASSNDSVYLSPWYGDADQEAGFNRSCR